MSIANILLLESRAIVVTDTISYNKQQAPNGLMHTKCRIARNGKYCITGRGVVRALDRLSEMFFRVAEDFDDCILAIEPIRSIVDPSVFTLDDGTELIIIGFSGPNKDRVKAIVINYKLLLNGVVECKHSYINEGLSLRPALPFAVTAKLPKPENITQEGMLKIALAVHKLKEMKGLKTCIGGVIHITEVSDGRIYQSIAGTFPDYDQHAALFSCPNFDDVMLFRRKAA